MTYRNDVLSVAVTYLLTGGTAGSHTSDVAETIRIVNTGRSAIDLHFFQYSDFDLNGTNAGQTVTMLNDNTVRQSGAGMVMSETVVIPTATHHEANLYGSIVSSLSDDSPTTLSGANGPVSGDATWAFQWDRTIAAGGTFLISKDKNLSAAVPEPASIMLLGGCLLLVARKFRRV